MDAVGMVGRGAELEVIDLALDRLVDADESIHLLIAGEPGYGKTTLLGEVARRAEARGVLVLRGRAPSVGGSLLAFSPVASALARHLDALEADQRGLLVGGLASLSRLIETLPGDAPVANASPDSDAERMLLFQSVSLLLARIARSGPVILAIDDLHWSDSATVELLGFLDADLAAEPIGLVVALRPGDAEHRPDVRRVLADLLGREKADRIDLAELDEQAVAALIAPLLGGVPSRRLTREVARRSGGVPLAAQAIARELVATRSLQLTAAGLDARPEALRIPDYVVDLFGERVRSLDGAERAVVLAVAVAHRPARLDEIAAVSGQSRVSTRDAVDHLVRLQLVSADGTLRSAVEMAHPLAAEAVLADVTAPEKRDAHARWVETLIDSAATDYEVAVHLVDSGDAVPAERAISILESAGVRALASGASDSAARCLGEAAVRARAATGPSRQRLCGILAAQSLVWRDLGELRAAEACLREAAHELAVDEPGRAAGLLCRAADLAWVRGDLDAAERQIDEAGVLVGRAEPVDVVKFEAERFYLLAKLGRYEDFAASTAAVDAASDRAGPSRTVDLVRSNVAIARALVESGSVEDALGLLPADWVVAGDSGDHTSVGLVLEGLCLLGRWDEARMVLGQQAGAGVASTSARWWRMPTAAFDIAVATGQWGAAADLLADEVMVLIARLRCRHFLHHAHLLTLHGRFDEARGAIARARDYGEGSFDTHESFATALAVIIADAEGSGVSEVDGSGWRRAHSAMATPLVQANMGLWLVRCGRTGEALDLADQLGGMGAGTSRIGGVAARVSGLATAVTDAEAGRRRLLEAAATFDRLAMPFEAARARLEACEAAPGPGDVELLGPEVVRLDDLGAEPWALRARRLIGSAPAPARPATLTPREREVALLVAEGLTNAEIAERLFVSIRTVTSHLDHAYTKLGIGSRAALTAYILRNGEDT